MKRFIAYARVSTIRQTQGTSLQNQETTINTYCTNNNIQLIKTYKDEGISAYTKRLGFQQALTQLRNQSSLNGIIVYDLTRFGRSTIELITTINEIDQLGKEFISIKESIDISTKTGRLLLTMLSAIADYEHAVIKERMMSGREIAKIEGTRSGLPLHRPEKQINWEEVMKLRKYNISWTKIADVLSHDSKNPDYMITHQTLIKHAKKRGLIP